MVLALCFAKLLKEDLDWRRIFPVRLYGDGADAQGVLASHASPNPLV